jgi:hypothetical protein
MPHKRRKTKTYLDLLLDRVKPRKHEVTIDTEGYTREQVKRIKSAAKKRGLHAAYDGRFVLIRDLRS